MSDISIIVPVYNVPEILLRRCIWSLVNQTLKGIEVILVDDGSLDNSGKICDEFAIEDNRILVIHKTNGGLSSARNAGLQRATSEWVMFVDGDDWIEVFLCEKLIDNVTDDNVDLIMFGMYKDYGTKSSRYSYNVEPYKVYKKTECVDFQIETLKYNSNVSSVTTKLFKRAVLLKHQLYHDEELRQGAEGIEYSFRVFGEINSMMFIPVFGYHYTYNRMSITSSYCESNYECITNCFNKIYNEIKKCENTNVLFYWLKNRMCYALISIAINGYFSPINQEPYRSKKKKYMQFINNDLYREVIDHPNTVGMTMMRKITFEFIRRNMTGVIAAVALLNYLKKEISMLIYSRRGDNT